MMASDTENLTIVREEEKEDYTKRAALTGCYSTKITERDASIMKELYLKFFLYEAMCKTI